MGATSFEAGSSNPDSVWDNVICEKWASGCTELSEGEQQEIHFMALDMIYSNPYDSQCVELGLTAFNLLSNNRFRFGNRPPGVTVPDLAKHIAAEPVSGREYDAMQEQIIILSPNLRGSLDSVKGILVHEVAHAWGARVDATYTGEERTRWIQFFESIAEDFEHGCNY